MIEKISRLSLALIWLYHGLVPKILFKSEQEILMNSTFLPFLGEDFTLIASGILELIYAALLLVFFRSTKLLLPSIVFGVLATIAILIMIPELLQNAFNPFTTNLAVLALSVINWIAIRESSAA